MVYLSDKMAIQNSIQQYNYSYNNNPSNVSGSK